MKAYNHLLTLVVLSLASIVMAQDGRYVFEPIEVEDAYLTSEFSQYTIIDINTEELFEYSQSKGSEHFELNFRIGEDFDATFHMSANDIRHPEYQLVALTEAGREVLPSRPNIVYSGGTATDLKKAAYVITPTMMVANFWLNREEYFMEPLSHFIDDSRAGYHLLYKTTDRIRRFRGSCGYDPDAERKGMTNETRQSGPAANDRSTSANCIEVDLAIAVDFSVFQQYGSVDSIEERFLAKAAMVELNYDPFDMDYLVTTIFVVTSLAVEPWVATSDADVLKPDFANWGDNSWGVIHDIGQLFTNRDLFGCGSGTSLLGCSHVKDVCTSNRYNINEDLNDIGCLKTLSTHEIGHNWDGVHSDADSNGVFGHTIMWPGLFNCSASIWTIANQNRINAYAASRTCIEDCNTACPLFYTIIDDIPFGHWEYEASIGITSSSLITGLANVTFDAGTFIRLENGFNGGLGVATFHGYIDGCGGAKAVPGHHEVTTEMPNKSEVPVIEDGAHMEVSVYPNPFTDAVVVEVTIQESKQLQMVILDAQGRIVETFTEMGAFPAGKHTYTWPAGDIAPGVYAVVVRSEAESITQRLIKVRR